MFVYIKSQEILTTKATSHAYGIRHMLLMFSFLISLHLVFLSHLKLHHHLFPKICFNLTMMIQHHQNQMKPEDVQ